MSNEKKPLKKTKEKVTGAKAVSKVASKTKTTKPKKTKQVEKKEEKKLVSSVDRKSVV